MKAKYFLATIACIFSAAFATAQNKYPEKPDLKWTPPANYYTIDPSVNNTAKIEVANKVPEGPGSESKPAQPAAVTPAVKPVQRKVVGIRKTKNK